MIKFFKALAVSVAIAVCGASAQAQFLSGNLFGNWVPHTPIAFNNTGLSGTNNGTNAGLALIGASVISNGVSFGVTNGFVYTNGIAALSQTNIDYVVPIAPGRPLIIDTLLAGTNSAVGAGTFKYLVDFSEDGYTWTTNAQYPAQVATPYGNVVPLSSIVVTNTPLFLTNQPWHGAALIPNTLIDSFKYARLHAITNLDTTNMLFVTNIFFGGRQ